MPDELACIVAALSQSEDLPVVQSPESRGVMMLLIDYATARRRKRGAPKTAPKVATLIAQLKILRAQIVAEEEAVAAEAARAKSASQSGTPAKPKKAAKPRNAEARLDILAGEPEMLEQLAKMDSEMERVYGFTLQNIVKRVWAGESENLIWTLQDFRRERELSARKTNFEHHDDEAKSFSLESMIS